MALQITLRNLAAANQVRLRAATRRNLNFTYRAGTGILNAGPFLFSSSPLFSFSGCAVLLIACAFFALLFSACPVL
ncbi:hypothetical protein HOY80DRAFT_956735 [Tuber brumale]|nr:hypothetical protein HOY80DRAFT_956735 [Tuber brumale]